MKRAAAAVLGVPLALAALAAALAGPVHAADGVIKVGAVSTLSGAGASPESVRGAQAYFDAVNANGGVRGRRIVLVSLDDRADPAAAQAAAAQLAADPDIVVLGGGSSVLDCAVNHGRYAAAGLVSVPGGGIDPACFQAPGIVPVNAGPYVSMANALSFAREVLKRSRPCVVSPVLPGMLEAFDAGLQGWARRHREAPPPMERFTLEEPLPPIAERVARRGCDAVVFTGPNVVRWVRAARQALPASTAQIFLTPAYTSQVAAELGAAGDGLYAMAEFEPWNSRSLQLTDWRHLMVSAKVPLSSLSQGGYLAAQMLVRAMRTVNGPINRATMAQALRAMPPVPNALTAHPFQVGAKPDEKPNRSALPMVLREGHWRVAHPQWITQPAAAGR
jgi:branched-chain amino acid transport system substrate-binding protein